MSDQPVRQWLDPSNPQHPHIQWNNEFKRLSNGCRDMTASDFRLMEAMHKAGCTPQQAMDTLTHLAR